MIAAYIPFIQAQLKPWFEWEIAEAMVDDRGLLGPLWWVWRSHAKCGHCGLCKVRVTIRAHPAGPIYVCIICGTIETLADLTR